MSKENIVKPYLLEHTAFKIGDYVITDTKIKGYIEGVSVNEFGNIRYKVLRVLKDGTLGQNNVHNYSKLYALPLTADEN